MFHAVGEGGRAAAVLAERRRDRVVDHAVRAGGARQPFAGSRPYRGGPQDVARHDVARRGDGGEHLVQRQCEPFGGRRVDVGERQAVRPVRLHAGHHALGAAARQPARLQRVRDGVGVPQERRFPGGAGRAGRPARRSVRSRRAARTRPRTIRGRPTRTVTQASEHQGGQRRPGAEQDADRDESGRRRRARGAHRPRRGPPEAAPARRPAKAPAAMARPCAPGGPGECARARRGTGCRAATPHGSGPVRGARSSIATLTASSSSAGGGAYGENAASTCATPGHDLPVRGGGQVAPVLADEPLPVGGALGMPVGDADDGPDVRHLLGPGGVEPQRPSARLDDRRRGGRRGQVDQRVDAAGVPALAEQRAGADEDPAVALLEERA